MSHAAKLRIGMLNQASILLYMDVDQMRHSLRSIIILHGDVIKWKHFPRYWPFVRGIHRWPVNFPHKGQWRRALTFSLISDWMSGWVNNREAANLRRHHANYDAVVILVTLPIVCYIGNGTCALQENTLMIIFDLKITQNGFRKDSDINCLSSIFFIDK